ncbi:hypothetical protein Metli_1825 [Methanofollis liminatans DSM 4140]|jgi:hypothetical protein|uniref:Uncharacterized protein n=2 Tax=Methanofollis liminatans TaxID=2201 RepID=J0SAQ6_9EURY|nr:hypothetical protein Metli_1825 [Methanofollis liminatans DSM 4140]
MLFRKMSSSYRTILIAALILSVALVLPVAAVTTSITVTKYADNNYSQSVDAETFNLSQLRTLSSVYSNGPVYMQGPTFDSNDPWGDGGQNMINFYGHNGSRVSNITDEVGGMSDGDELKVQSSDGFSLYFGYDNVYAPDSSQGDMIVAWWDSDYGFVPDYTYGMRLFFYTPPSSYGVDDSLNLTLRDMEASFDPWYRHNYSLTWPSAKGLSSKYVQYLKIYPPHRYDFNTTGDTVEYAYEGDVDGVPGTSTVPSTAFSSTANIAADDSVSYQTDSENEGEYAAQRFVFNVAESAGNIEKIAVTWVGTGTNAGDTDGADLYIWNGSNYELLQSSTSSSEVTLSGEKTSSISDYINDGNVTVLVKQKSASNGDDASTLATDYVKFVVTHHHAN